MTARWWKPIPCRPKAWQEDALARVTELKAVAEWAFKYPPDARHDEDELKKQELKRALDIHLKCAQDAAKRRYHIRGNGQTIHRALCNLYVAETHLIHFAPWRYVLGQMPSLLNHVQ